MDIIETFLKLPESERQKLTETLLLLRNVGANVRSNDSAGKSGTDLKDSLNLSNNTPEKPVSKQKTLDSWIVKNKTPPSNCEKEVTHSKEIVPIAETDEASRNYESEEVSSTLQDHQLPCSSSAPIEKSSKSENVNKKLMVLLNRQDCLESKHESPEHSEFSFEKKSISPIEIKSSKKHVHVSENPAKKILSPEKPTPPRSYNLRSARGVSDEKPSSETSNSFIISPESEDRDKIHRTVTKQKPKFKNSVEKDASPNYSTCFKEVNQDQKTDSCNDIISKENTKSSDCKTPSTVVNSELEKTSKVISIDNNKITITDENPIPVELDATLVVKGKRKRNSKCKESKKLCVANIAQKSSHEEIKVNSKSAKSIISKKVTKLNAINENPSESSIEKTVQLPGTDESTSPNQKQISTNGTVKSVSKLKLNKTTKRKDKNDLILHEKTKLDSTATKVKKKNLPNPEIDSGITKNVDFQIEISDKQLKSATTSESQSKECAKEMEELFTKAVTSVNVDSKRISRKRVCQNKSMKAAKNSLLSDSEMASKINDEDGTETSSKIYPSQNKECAKEIEKLLTKDMNSGTSVNVDSKRISRKRDSENKSLKAAKKSLLSDSELASKNNDKDRITSIETSSKISPSQNNEFPKETEELLMKDTNTLIPITVSSKKKFRKRGIGNKNMVAAKNSLSSDSGQASKNDDEDSITSTETSSIDSSTNSPSQSKECSTEAEELLMKNTIAVTSVNVGSKRGIGNKSVATTKNSLICDTEQASKIGDKDRIASIETSSSQNNEFAKETEELLIKDTNTVIAMNVSSNKKIRRRGSENKSLVAAKNSLASDSGEASKNDDEDSITSETSLIDSSKNSPSQSKECSKEAEELLIKDLISVNVDSKRTSRKRGIKSKSMVTTMHSLVSDSEQASKNSDKDNITSIKISSNESSKNSPSSITKELSVQQTSSINNISTTEKITISLNQNKYSQSVIPHSHSGDHSRKNSLNSSNNELDSLNEMKESPEDQSQKSSAVSPNMPKSNDNNALHPEGNSNLSGVSKKVNTLKKKIPVPANSRKKLKVTKDENQPNTPQNISDNLSSEMENHGLNLKKSGSKKKFASLKLKVVTDSSKEHSDGLITKSKASSSDSNVVQELKDQLIKNLKLNNKLSQGQKIKMKVKNSKKVKESHSTKKSNSLESQAVSTINLSKNDEIEKLNSDLVVESSMKNKLCKTNKKASIQSTNKEKSIREEEHGSSPEKPTENEHSSEKSSEVQMELDSFHSMEKPETCDNSTSSYNSVDSKKAQGMIPDISMDISDSSKSRKAKYDTIQDKGGNIEKAADLTVNGNSNHKKVAQTDFKSPVEFEEKMMNNCQAAFCKVKEVLEALGISIEEFFENPEMINSLNSASPDGAIKIHKCKSDSKLSICVSESEKEMNILNKLKKKHNDQAK